MNKTSRTVLFWAPRLLGILFLLLLGMFSLDVFGMGGRFWETILAFLLHSIPAFILLAFFLFGWRREWVGAVGFLLFGTWYFIFAFGVDRSAYLVLGGVPLLIAALFFVGWVFRKQIRARLV